MLVFQFIWARSWGCIAPDSPEVLLNQALSTIIFPHNFSRNDNAYVVPRITPNSEQNEHISKSFPEIGLPSINCVPQ